MLQLFALGGVHGVTEIEEGMMGFVGSRSNELLNSSFAPSQPVELR